MKGWEPRLALRKRLKVIRKWPIEVRGLKANCACSLTSGLSTDTLIHYMDNMIPIREMIQIFKH